MFLTLIRRELLDNLMTFRFAAAVVITLLLVVANTVVLIKDYEQRLADITPLLKRTGRNSCRRAKPIQMQCLACGGCTLTVRRTR